MKKIGSGFAFRIVQAIIYLLAFSGFLFGSIWLNQGSISNYVKKYCAENEIGSEGLSVSFDYDSPHHRTGDYKLVVEQDSLVLKHRASGSNSNSDYTVIGSLKSDSQSEKIITFECIDGSNIQINYDEVDSYCYYEYETSTNMSFAFMIVAIIMSVFMLLEFIVAFFGRKSIAANNCGIALNFLFSLSAFGLCGLIGAIKGRMYLQFKHNMEIMQAQLGAQNQSEEYVEAATAGCTVENSATSQEVGSDETYATTQNSAAVRQANVKSGTKLSDKIFFIAVCVLYAAFLIMGIVGMAAPSSGLLWSSGDMAELEIIAANFITGLAILPMCATVGLFIAFCSPLKTNRKAMFITLGVTAAVMLVLDIVFFVVKSTADEGMYELILSASNAINGNLSDSTAISVSLILSQVGVILIYALKFVPVNPDKIAKLSGRIENSGGSELVDAGNKVIAMLLNCLKAILRFRYKHERAFVFIATFMMTFGVFVSLYVIVVAIVLVVIVGLVIFFGKFYVDTPRRDYVIIEGGYERVLKYNGYYLGSDKYVDDIGRTWFTDDNGSTFYLGK